MGRRTSVRCRTKCGSTERPAAALFLDIEEVADDAVGDHELFGWYPVHIAFADYQAVSEKLAGTIFEVEQSLEPEPFGERVASNTVIGTEGGHDIFVVLVYAGEDFPSVYPVGTGQFDVLFEVVDRVDTLVPVVGVGRWAEAR